MKLAKQANASATWANVKSAAGTYYGLGSAKYNKLVADADKFGIDDDQF